MTKNLKIQLLISTLIIVLGIVAMIVAGNIDLMFLYVYFHIWWVIIVTKVITIKYPDKKKFLGASLTVLTGFAVYFLSLWYIIPTILELFGVPTSF